MGVALETLRSSAISHQLFSHFSTGRTGNIVFSTVLKCCQGGFNEKTRALFRHGNSERSRCTTRAVYNRGNVAPRPISHTVVYDRGNGCGNDLRGLTVVNGLNIPFNGYLDIVIIIGVVRLRFFFFLFRGSSYLRSFFSRQLLGKFF